VPASPATRGIWIDLLSLMWIDDAAAITGTLADLAALARCVMGDVTRFIKRRNACASPI
jgi:hypothetical protein